MSNLLILVVEDEQNWQEELKQILQRLGGIVSVDVASDYESALDYVGKEKYDLIIVDLSLRGNPLDSQNTDQHGMDLLPVVRQSQNNKHCGLIVLTGRGSIPRTKQALRDYSVQDFIEKNEFDADNFMEIVRSAIRDARLNRAEAKARARWFLTVTFNQDRLVSSELTGPNRHLVHLATNKRRFKTADLIRRADNLNSLVLNGEADIWRPEVRSIGKAIHDTLSKEQCFQKGLIAARALAQHPGDLWLQFSGPAKDLGTPFELLYDGHDYLCQTHMLTRRLVENEPTFLRKIVPLHMLLTELLRGKEMLRILIVGANSDDNIPGAEREAASLKVAIESDLQQLNIACQVTVLSGVEASYQRVSEALRDGRYHIFHYAGHGLYHETLPEISGLLLHEGNKLRVLTAADLNLLVRDTQLHFVFLSCCLGAHNASERAWGDFHGVLEALISAGVPSVLGYRWTVADQAAMRLAQVFYETLWRTFSPGEALLEARVRAALGPKGRDDETWVSPVLLMQNM